LSYRVAVIKFRRQCGNGTGSFEVKIGTDTVKFTSMVITRPGVISGKIVQLNKNRDPMLQTLYY